MSATKFRLVTRSDFDGLVCGMLLREMDLIDDITFVHPKDVQDGKVAVAERDILTNLPSVPGCHLAFDHHASELVRLGEAGPASRIINCRAPSAARVVYDHFGGETAFPHFSPELLHAVDKADSARFSRDEVLNPAGWTLLNFIMDSRTGLGRFHKFRISNYELMMQLIERCRHSPVEEVLALPDVKERVDLFMEHHPRFIEQVKRCTTVYGDLALLDLRQESVIYAGNRFMIYALFPQCTISAHVMWGVRQQNTVFALGRSIFDRSSTIDIGRLCLAYGGGGHAAAGTCQVANEDAATVARQLIQITSGQEELLPA